MSLWIIDENADGCRTLQIPEGVYDSIEEFLAERAGDPNEGTINLDELDYSDGWYNYDYGRFKIIRGDEVKLNPEEVTTKVELTEA